MSNAASMAQVHVTTASGEALAMLRGEMLSVPCTCMRACVLAAERT